MIARGVPFGNIAVHRCNGASISMPDEFPIQGTRQDPAADRPLTAALPSSAHYRSVANRLLSLIDGPRDVILLHATVKLEAVVACSSAERSATAVLEAARLFVRGNPSSSALDASAVFVDLCALLTDHDVAIRRDACRLLASVPLARVPAQRLSQAVSKRPIKETVPGAPVQRASKIGRTAPLESVAALRPCFAR